MTTHRKIEVWAMGVRQCQPCEMSKHSDCQRATTLGTQRVGPHEYCGCGCRAAAAHRELLEAHARVCAALRNGRCDKPPPTAGEGVRI